ncbi:MAG: glycosyltransferase [Coriobacteriia bacterium]|nr:glycosyltransferase [Coriobacteriia bacterium]
MRVDNAFTHDPRVKREAQALADAGYDITVIADARQDPCVPDNETVDNIRIRRIRKSSRIPYWSIVRPLLEEHADIYHGHDIDSLFPVIAAATRGGRKVKAVYDSHELWSGHAPDKIHAKRRQLLRFEGAMLRRADALITASPAYTEAIVERHSYKGPAQTLLNVPRMYTDAELRPHWDAREANPLVIVAYVSVFQHGRGAVPLIKSLAHLPKHFVLDLIGPIPQPEYEKLMRQAAAPFDDRVRFVGQVPAAEIMYRLAASHISAVPIEPLSLSYRLTAPNKLFDSLMAGTPILASDMHIIADVTRAERAGEVCNVADPADVARAIKAAYGHRWEYGRNGRAAAMARYNWDAEKDKLLGLYEELLPS